MRTYVDVPRPKSRFSLVVLVVLLAACGPLPFTATPPPTVPSTATVRPTLTNTPLPPEPVAACVIGRTLKLRSQPTTASTILGGLLAGTCVKVFGTNSQGDWAYIQSDKGTGWVSMQYLELSGDIAQLPVLPAAPGLAQLIEPPSATVPPAPTLLPATSAPSSTNVPLSPSPTQAGVPAAVNTMQSRGYTFQFHREEDPYWEASSPQEGWTFRVYDDGGFAMGGRFDKDRNVQTQASADFFEALGVTADQASVTVKVMVDAMASADGEASVCDQGLSCSAQVVQAQQLYLWICNPQG